MEYADHFNNKNILIISKKQNWINNISEQLTQYNINIDTCDCFKKCKACELKFKKSDAIIIDYNLSNLIKTTDFIKYIKEIKPKSLILSVSVDFKDNKNLKNTRKMLKAMNAGCTRISYKSVEYIKNILMEHFAIRESKVLEEII